MSRAATARRAALLALLVAAVAAAGCIGGGDDGGGSAADTDAADADGGGNGTGPGPGPGPSAGPGDAGGSGNATDDPVGPPENRTLFLAPGPSLADEAPRDASVTLSSGPGNVVYDGPMAIFASDPLREPALVTPPGSNLTLWVEADAPVPSNGAIDLGVWFGSSRGMHHIGAAAVPALVLQPGEPVEVQIPMPAQGERAAYVPAGEKLQLHVAQLMAPDRTGLVNVLVGESNPSQVTFTARPLNETPTVATTPSNQSTIEGTIPASSDAVGCDAMEGVTTHVHTLSVMEGASLLELTLEAQDTPFREDLDMFLQDGDTTVQATTSIDHTENILLAGPTLEGLDGRDLTLRVVACSAHATGYTVNVAQG